jgi:three-Cys-motif partner protein
MTPQRGRSWGFWTRLKLKVLADYLEAFLKTTKDKAEEVVYLDAFAGESTGVDRITGEKFAGSVRIALEAGSDIQFTRLRFFEQPGKAEELQSGLQSEFPDRDLKVYPGDCNDTIPRALGELSDLRWAPTFAFLDPDGMELSWETIEALANHKIGYRAVSSTKPEFKVELWMLFPSMGLIRTLARDETKMSKADEERATRLLGDESWRAIYAARVREEIDGATAREEYVNLMRYRLEQDLGYRWTHSLEIKNEHGNPLYHMIFATDNEAGTEIMEFLYRQALGDIPAMRREAIDQRRGQQVLDLGGDLGAEPDYRYEPPWEPPSR